MPKIQSKELKKLNKLKCTSEEGGKDLGGKVDWGGSGGERGT